MMDFPVGVSTTISGGVVGLVLGLVGGGGSILAVPLLVYAVGVTSPHIAIGTSAIAVSLSALGNVVSHARAGNVKWRCAAVFASAGVIGAVAGSTVAKALDGQKLLVLFGALMIVVGLTMLRKRSAAGNPEVRLSMTTARELLPLLLSIGFAVGLLSGFFGIGGGFLIVPGLMLATGMPLTMAIGTSLVAVAAFGAATAASYAVSGNDRLADCQPVRSRRPGWRHSRRRIRKSARSKEAGTQSDVRGHGYSGRPVRRRARNGAAVRGLKISYSRERTVAW